MQKICLRQHPQRRADSSGQLIAPSTLTPGNLAHAIIQINARSGFTLQSLQSAFDRLQLTLQQLNIAQVVLFALLQALLQLLPDNRRGRLDLRPLRQRYQIVQNLVFLFLYRFESR